MAFPHLNVGRRTFPVNSQKALAVPPQGQPLRPFTVHGGWGRRPVKVFQATVDDCGFSWFIVRKLVNNWSNRSQWFRSNCFFRTPWYSRHLNQRDETFQELLTMSTQLRKPIASDKPSPWSWRSLHPSTDLSAGTMVSRGSYPKIAHPFF